MSSMSSSRRLVEITKVSGCTSEDEPELLAEMSAWGVEEAEYVPMTSRGDEVEHGVNSVVPETRIALDA
jgi:hypothetical protein